jgi:2-polyprenyl-6-methoxyphenol hydroxylase-like FAD-dependent oxidoreductase
MATSTLEGRHVVVVGAGIGGSAASVLLARAGARVTLLERDRRPASVGGGLLLQPNGLAVLYGLGLREHLVRHGTRLTRLRIANAAGRTLVDVGMPRFAEGLDHALVMRRDDLESALRQLVAAQPSIACQLETELTGLSRDGTLTCRRHGHDPTSMTADLIVGADGVHSRVRKRSGLPARVGRTWWYARGIGPSLPGLSGMTEYWTKLGIFGIAPVRDGTYFYAATHAEPIADALRERDVALFRQSWIDTLPVAADVLRNVTGFDDMVVSQVIRIDCPRWTQGRVVLLGDAAHAMAPNLGQGASSALVDATALAWELEQTANQTEALLRYEQRRRTTVRGIQRLADRLGWLSHFTHPAARWLRDTATRRLAPALIGDVSQRFVEQSDPLWLRRAAGNENTRTEAS